MKESMAAEAVLMFSILNSSIYFAAAALILWVLVCCRRGMNQQPFLKFLLPYLNVLLAAGTTKMPTFGLRWLLKLVLDLGYFLMLLGILLGSSLVLYFLYTLQYTLGGLILVRRLLAGQPVFVAFPKPRHTYGRSFLMRLSCILPVSLFQEVCKVQGFRSEKSEALKRYPKLRAFLRQGRVGAA